MTQIGHNVENWILAFLSSLQVQWHEVVRHMRGIYSCKCLKMKGLEYVFKLEKKSSFIAPAGNLLADSLLFGSFEK